LRDSTEAPVGVALHDVTLSYAGAPLFRGLDLTLAAGRTTCLLGPSGVGKSSLIRLIAGLELAESGRVEASDGRPLQGRIAWMGQRDSLLPWLTVNGNVTLGARLRGEMPDAGAAVRLLARVGLEGFEERDPRTLSGGQRQRVALARTLMEQRPVILMDEPFSALDTITRTRLQALAASLLRERTVLLVTHDPLEALRLGHEVLVMSGQPATVETLPRVTGEPPRDVADPAVLAMQGDLLARLGAADDRAA
jgi:putative hydroxymethylpyrimidine transport system ATP-binding protein